MAPYKARKGGSDAAMNSDDSTPDTNENEISHQGIQGAMVRFLVFLHSHKSFPAQLDDYSLLLFSLTAISRILMEV